MKDFKNALSTIVLFAWYLNYRVAHLFAVTARIKSFKEWTVITTNGEHALTLLFNAVVFGWYFLHFWGMIIFVTVITAVSLLWSYFKSRKSGKRN